MRINEILTIDELLQPPENIKKEISDECKNHYKDNLYYFKNGANTWVISKNEDKILGYILAVEIENPNFKSIPRFIIPKNIYSWANDKGKTALELIKAVINLSNVPVLSDIELSPSSKKFLQIKIEDGSLVARTFNLDTGDVTPYDSSIWKNDDDYRVLILENKFGYPVNNKRSIQLTESTWNWIDRQQRLGKKQQAKHHHQSQQK